MMEIKHLMNKEANNNELVDIVLIYPQLGSFDNIFRDIPLSLIFAASDSVKYGFNVKILDLRITRENWKNTLDEYIKRGASLIGLSVMTGNPILTSLEITKYVKSRYTTPIVWGGPHPTILPEQTLQNENIDYVIRDWGSAALCELTRYLKGDLTDIHSILGLGFKKDGQTILNPPRCNFEMPHYLDLPYHLVDISSENYNRLANGETILPIFTAMGCPYQCTFCMSPAVYKKVKGKKWVAYKNEEVWDHIQYLSERYKFHRLQIYDDDSFVDLTRLRELLEGYVRRGFHKKYVLDFRGARINELDRMDESLVQLLVEANVEMMAIGAESGSPASLQKMNKGITVEQTTRVNKKLAKFPTLKPHYNLFCGIPGETYEDLLETKKFILQLVKDNPNCYLGVGADWKPLPGSEMTDNAVKDYDLKLPQCLEEWASIDSFDAKKIVHPWYTPKIDNMIKLLQISGMVLDKKIFDFKKDLGPIVGNAIYFMSLLYKPLLMLRLRYNYTSFLLEYDIKNFLLHNLGRTIK